MIREFKVRRHRRQAAGRLPRDDHPAGDQAHLHAQEADRRLAASSPTSPSTSSPPAPAAATSSSTRSPADRIPKEFIPSVDAGIQSMPSTPGVLAGYPTVDVRAILVDGTYHDVDSSEMAFKIAGSMAFKEAAPQGEARAARADHGGGGRHARGLHGRRRSATSTRRRGPRRRHGAARATARSSRAQVPLSEMFGYATDLRSRTQGRATYTMQFDVVPADAQRRAGRDRHQRIRGE